MEENTKTIDLHEKLSGILNDEKKLKLFVGLGICLMLVIFISGILPEKQEDTTPASESVEQDINTIYTYEKNIEVKVQDFVKTIAGVGKVNVMVTVENEIEYIYQSEIKSSTNSSNEDYEENIVIIDDKNKGEQALIKTIIPPKIQGIAVSCEGGANANVKFMIIDSLTKVYGLTSSQISVTTIDLKE